MGESAYKAWYKREHGLSQQAVDENWSAESSKDNAAEKRLKDGGCAFPSAAETSARAYMGSWALVFLRVCATLGTTSMEAFVAGPCKGPGGI